jgi:hypothetical protein
MKQDQLAWYCATPAAADQLKEDFGLLNAEWIVDQVTAKSKVTFGFQVLEDINIAELQFCYTLGGTELEIIRYLSGPHWHHEHLNDRSPSRFISHVGIHLDDGEPFPLMPHSRLVQETFTLKHTSQYLTDPKSPGFGRTYHYRIHAVSPHNYVKYIRRIHPHGEVSHEDPPSQPHVTPD